MFSTDSFLIWPLAALPLLAATLVAGKGRRWPVGLAYKAAVSALVVVAGASRWDGAWGPGALVVAALVLCLAGDILLAVPGNRPLAAGMAAFGAAHLGYLAAFGWQAGFGWAGLGLFGLLVSAAAVTARQMVLAPGPLMLPAVAYGLVICLMAAAAGRLALDSRLELGLRLAVAAGAIAFAGSDMLVARQRFGRRSAVNRWVGLPLYYAAQFSLAWAAGLMAVPSAG